MNYSSERTIAFLLPLYEIHQFDFLREYQDNGSLSELHFVKGQMCALSWQWCHIDTLAAFHSIQWT